MSVSILVFTFSMSLSRKGNASLLYSNVNWVSIWVLLTVECKFFNLPSDPGNIKRQSSKNYKQIL